MINFSLHQTIKFNKPLREGAVHISPGGYNLTFWLPEGREESRQFDLTYTEGYIDTEDPTLYHVTQTNPDFAEFPDIKDFTKEMLSNVVKINDWYIDLETVDPKEEPYQIVEIVSASFGIFEKDTIGEASIPSELLKNIVTSSPAKTPDGFSDADLGFHTFVFYTVKKESDMKDKADVVVDELWLPSDETTEYRKSDIINISLNITNSIQGTNIPKNMKRRLWKVKLKKKSGQDAHHRKSYLILKDCNYIVKAINELGIKLFSETRSDSLAGDALLGVENHAIEYVAVKGFCDPFDRSSYSIYHVYPPEIQVASYCEEVWMDVKEKIMDKELKKILCVLSKDHEGKFREMKYDLYEPVIMK